MKEVEKGTWVGPEYVQCPNPDCDYKFDAASAIDSSDGPSRDDLSICAKCTSFLIYTDPPHVRLLTDEEFEKLPQDNQQGLMYARVGLQTAHEKRKIHSQKAKRPTNYPSLSPREQWKIDKHLGILDAE